MSWDRPVVVLGVLLIASILLVLGLSTILLEAEQEPRNYQAEALPNEDPLCVDGVLHPAEILRLSEPIPGAWNKVHPDAFGEDQRRLEEKREGFRDFHREYLLGEGRTVIYEGYSFATDGDAATFFSEELKGKETGWDAGLGDQSRASIGEREFTILTRSDQHVFFITERDRSSVDSMPYSSFPGPSLNAIEEWLKTADRISC